MSLISEKFQNVSIKTSVLLIWAAVNQEASGSLWTNARNGLKVFHSAFL